jgi:hypothetical protein
MAEAVGALRGGPISALGKPNPAVVRDAVLPLLMVVLFLVALSATLDRAGVLRSWSSDFSGRGEFLVESCGEILNRGADQWGCRGWFTPEGQATVEGTQLVTSHGARASGRPYVGQQLGVFFEVGRFGQVYPVEYQLNELTRLYLSFIPRLMVMIGALLWLVGWFTTRNLDADDPITKDSVRFPQRFNWRGRGVTWIVAAVGVAALNYVVTTRLIGSLGIV